MWKVRNVEEGGGGGAGLDNWNINSLVSLSLNIVTCLSCQLPPPHAQYRYTDQHICYIQSVPVLRSRSRWSRIYLKPGAGANIIFLINIYCSQFEGCQDEEKPPMSHISYGFIIIIHF